MIRISLTAATLLAASSVIHAGGFAAPVVTQVTNLAPIPVVSVTINSVSSPASDSTPAVNGTAPAGKSADAQKSKPGSSAP